MEMLGGFKYLWWWVRRLFCWGGYVLFFGGSSSFFFCSSHMGFCRGGFLFGCYSFIFFFAGIVVVQKIILLRGKKVGKSSTVVDHALLQGEPLMSP